VEFCARAPIEQPQGGSTFSFFGCNAQMAPPTQRAERRDTRDHAVVRGATSFEPVQWIDPSFQTHPFEREDASFIGKSMAFPSRVPALASSLSTPSVGVDF